MMSSSARPARIRSGIGTELALSGSTGAPAVVALGGSSEPSEGSAPVVSVLRGVRPGRVRRRHLARRRIGGGGRCGLAALAVLERALDVLLRARVVAHVARQDLDRVVVAMQGVRAVDAAVVVPVVDHLAAARLGARRRATRPRASRETQPGRRARGVLLGPARGWRRGSRSLFRGVLPANCGAMLQSLSDGIDVGVSGW